LDIWRANTDTPKKRTRQITEASLGMAQMFYEIRGAELEKTKPDTGGFVGNQTVTDSGRS
jgi:hypothetical protein